MTAGPLTRQRPTTADTAAARDRVGVPEWLFVLATAVASLVALVPVLELWSMRLDVPFAYGADATFNLMVVRNLLDGGWVNTNASLGAPFGQELYDFPLGTDNLNLLVLKVLAVVTRDPAVAMNLFFLLTFPAVAVAAVLVLRRLGLSRPASFACAVLFAFAPYHFWRGETHLFLSSYVAVPLGAFLVAGDDRRGAALRAPGEGRLRWLSRRSLVTLALCAVIASTGLYYAFFTGLLVTVAAVVTAAARGRGAILASGLAAVGRSGRSCSSTSLPSLAYTAANGANEEPVEPVGRRVGAVRAEADPAAPPGRRPPARAARTPRAALRAERRSRRRIRSSRVRRSASSATSASSRCSSPRSPAPSPARGGAAARCSATRRCRRSSRCCSASRPGSPRSSRTR